MLHHVVFINDGVAGGPREAELVPGARAASRSTAPARSASGCCCRPATAIASSARDRWRMITMLMSHRLEADAGLARVPRDDRDVEAPHARHAAVAARERLRSALELHRRRRRRARLDRRARRRDWTMPISGRIVAAGAHLHGSAKSLDRQPAALRRSHAHRPPAALRACPTTPSTACDRACTSRDRSRPGYFLSSTRDPGAPGRAAAGHRALRRASSPHPAVMAITHVYVAPDAARAERLRRRCPPTGGSTGRAQRGRATWRPRRSR